MENADILLMDRDLMQVVFSLTKAGHQQYVPEIVERMRHERGYVPGVSADSSVMSWKRKEYGTFQFCPKR